MLKVVCEVLCEQFTDEHCPRVTLRINYIDSNQIKTSFENDQCDIMWMISQ